VNFDTGLFTGYQKFPNPAAEAGARAYPLILPTSPQMDGASTGQRALTALGTDARR
jgi:hypothetical protein